MFVDIYFTLNVLFIGQRLYYGGEFRSQNINLSSDVFVCLGNIAVWQHTFLNVFLTKLWFTVLTFVLMLFFFAVSVDEF